MSKVTFKSLQSGKEFKGYISQELGDEFEIEFFPFGDDRDFTLFSSKTLGIIYLEGNLNNTYEIVKDKSGIYGKWLERIDSDKIRNQKEKQEKISDRINQMY